MKKEHLQEVLIKRNHFCPGIYHPREMRKTSVLLPERFGGQPPLAPSASEKIRMSPECDPYAVLLPESFTPWVGFANPFPRIFLIARYSVLFPLFRGMWGIYHIYLPLARQRCDFRRNEQFVNPCFSFFCRKMFAAWAHMYSCSERSVCFIRRYPHRRSEWKARKAFHLPAARQWPG